MQRRIQRTGVHVVHHRRRQVRRQRLFRTRVGSGELRPALLQGRVHLEVGVEPGDFPNAILLAIFILIDAIADHAGGVQVTGRNQRPPAALGVCAVRRDIHNGLDLGVIVQLAILRLAQPLQVLQHPRPTDEDAAATDFQRAVLGIQIRNLLPQVLVHVVPVGTLQDLDLALIIQSIHLPLQLRDAACRGRCGQLHHRHRGRIERLDRLRARVVVRRQGHRRPRLVDKGTGAIRRRQLPIRHIALGHLGLPAALLRHREGLEPVQLADLPDTVFLAVFALVGTGLPACVFVELPQQHNRAPAAFGRLAVGGEGDHRLQLHMLAQLLGPQSAFAVADGVQQRAGVRLAHEYSGRAVLHGRIIGEQVDNVVPVRAIQVVAIGALQALDRLEVRELGSLLLKLCDVRPGLRVTYLRPACSPHQRRDQYHAENPIIHGLPSSSVRMCCRSAGVFTSTPGRTAASATLMCIPCASARSCSSFSRSSKAAGGSCAMRSSDSTR